MKYKLFEMFAPQKDYISLFQVMFIQTELSFKACFSLRRASSRSPCFSAPRNLDKEDFKKSTYENLNKKNRKLYFCFSPLQLLWIHLAALRAFRQFRTALPEIKLLRFF